MGKYGRQVYLHGPGPSNVPKSVLEALASPTIGHLDPQFVGIMDETQNLLRRVFRSNGNYTLPISSSGSGGMETLVANFTMPSDEVLVVENGVFGGRISDTVRKYGGSAHGVEIEWGKTVTPDRLEDELKKRDYKNVWVVHAETSTGALQPDIKELSRLAHENGALFFVDTVTSLGGVPVEIDGWDADASYSGTQKCLSVPPGLSPAVLGERAIERLEKSVHTWYFDLNKIMDYWTGKQGNRLYHHTAPINMVYALHQGLSLVLNEGLGSAHARHSKNAAALEYGLENLGFRYIVEDPKQRLPMLHAVYVPDGVDEAALRGSLLGNHSIEIGEALGKFKGKAVRIGLMGASSAKENVSRLLGALEEEVGSQR